MFIDKESNFALVGHGYHLCYFYEQVKKKLKLKPIIITHIKKKHLRDIIQNKDNKVYKNLFELKGARIFEVSDINNKKTLNIFKKNNIKYIFSFSSRFIFKKNFLDRFQNRVFNLHPSILPEERGAGTFTNRILNEKFFVCASFHLVNKFIDAGGILLQTKKKKISKNSLPTDFLEKTNISYRELIDEMINKINRKHNFVIKKQDNSKKTYFARYDASLNGIINWYYDGKFIVNFIKSFSRPYLGAKTLLFLKKKIYELRIFNAKFVKSKSFIHPYLVGKIFFENKKIIKVITLGGYLEIKMKDLKLNSKKKLNLREKLCLISIKI